MMDLTRLDEKRKTQKMTRIQQAKQSNGNDKIKDNGIGERTDEEQWKDP